MNIATKLCTYISEYQIRNFDNVFRSCICISWITFLFHIDLSSSIENLENEHIDLKYYYHIIRILLFIYQQSNNRNSLSSKQKSKLNFKKLIFEYLNILNCFLINLIRYLTNNIGSYYKKIILLRKESWDYVFLRIFQLKYERDLGWKTWNDIFQSCQS